MHHTLLCTTHFNRAFEFWRISMWHGSHHFVFFAPHVCSPFDRTYGPIDSFLAGLYDDSIGYDKQGASSSHACSLWGGKKLGLTLLHLPRHDVFVHINNGMKLSYILGGVPRLAAVDQQLVEINSIGIPNPFTQYILQNMRG